MRSEWLNVPPARPDASAWQAALTRQGQLTKPPGSLGRLEALAVRLAALQGRARPSVDPVHISVFAADHGVAARGVSAFPQAVTAQMVRNFAQGGAAISVLARHLGARLEVIDLGTLASGESTPGVLELRLGPGSADFTEQPAMDAHQYARALGAGRQAAERAKATGARLFLGGEMGIGNTTAAAALACALLNADPLELAGPGTGLDAAGVAHKAGIIALGLARHQAHLDDPFQALRRLGGFEIAALAGAYLACGQIGLPALVDGFIASAAALAAVRLCPGLGDWLIFSHASAEPGHQRLLTALEAQPLLDLGMRLGEASGAAVAVPLLRLACALHNDMATFAEAGVAGP